MGAKTLELGSLTDFVAQLALEGLILPEQLRLDKLCCRPCSHHALGVIGVARILLGVAMQVRPGLLLRNLITIYIPIMVI